MTSTSQSHTVVIPTIGRPELRRAVESARQQGGENIQIVVVADLDTADPRADAVRAVGTDVEVIYTGGGARAARARNLGVSAARSQWVSFLDDDDYWLPRKTETQVEAAEQTGSTVVACRVAQVRASDLTTLAPSVPHRLLAESAAPAEYLFRKRRPGAGRASLFTSTLMVDTELAKEVPWDESLVRHQDWDWVIRLSDHPAFTMHHCPEVLTHIVVGSEGSISAGSNWQASLDWASRLLKERDSKVFVDFVSAQTLRYALQSRSWDGVRACARAIVRAKTVPSAGPLVIGAAGIVSRRGIERAMRVIH